MIAEPDQGRQHLTGTVNRIMEPPKGMRPAKKNDFSKV
jgi:hypothetical protein